jgi:hypothetical protein
MLFARDPRLITRHRSWLRASPLQPGIKTKCLRLCAIHERYRALILIYCSVKSQVHMTAAACPAPISIAISISGRFMSAESAGLVVARGDGAVPDRPDLLEADRQQIVPDRLAGAGDRRGDTAPIGLFPKSRSRPTGFLRPSATPPAQVVPSAMRSIATSERSCRWKPARPAAKSTPAIGAIDGKGTARGETSAGVWPDGQSRRCSWITPLP